MTGILQDSGVGDHSPRLLDLNFYLFALTLAYRRDLIQMSQRAVSLGLVFLRDWKWLLGDEHQSRASRQLNSFLGSCDTLLRSFLSHK